MLAEAKKDLRGSTAARRNVAFSHDGDSNNNDNEDALRFYYGTPTAAYRFPERMVTTSASER